MLKILLVDDDPMFLESMEQLLGSDYEVTSTTNPKKGVVYASDNYYDLVIVDNCMPEITGETFVELVSQLSPLQKMIVVSGQASVDAKLNILKNNNVDFVDKSVEPEILLRRIERVINSEKTNTVGARKIYSALEEIEVDAFYRTVTVKGESVYLTTKEFMLLSLFLTNKNHVLTREKIGEVVWNSSADQISRSIDVLVVKLRKKINTNLIVSKRGVGYVWREK